MILLKKFQIIVLIYFELLKRTYVSGSCGPLISNESQNVQVTCLGSVSQCKTKGAVIPHGTQAEVKCLHNYETSDSSNGKHILTCDWGRWIGQSLFDEMRCKIKCGRPAVENVGLIINGTETKRLKWPWHVAIFRDNFYICGGSIINPFGDELFILTAVHCTTMTDGTPLEPSKFKIVIGAVSSNLNENLKIANTQILGVKEIVRHENYDLQRHLEDIALVQTDQPIRVTPYSLPICLPSNEIMVSGQVKAGVTSGMVVGFGSTTGVQKVASEKLHEVTLPVVSTDSCHAILDQRPTSSQICAGTPDGPNTCSGDSGGGLVFRADHPIRYTIQGIVSSAPQHYGCKGISIFTKIFNYVRWIRLESDKLIHAAKRDGGKNTITPITVPTTELTTPRITLDVGYQLKDYENLAVRLHNKYRNNHHAPDVSIDPELSRKAQNWADHLIQTNSGLKTGGDCSENLYEYNGRTISPVEVIVNAITSWYNAKSSYTSWDPKPSTFTQIVWKSSKKIGVGISSNNDRTIVVVCYSPPGNSHVTSDNGLSYKENVSVDAGPGAWYFKFGDYPGRTHTSQSQTFQIPTLGPDTSQSQIFQIPTLSPNRNNFPWPSNFFPRNENWGS